MVPSLEFSCISCLLIQAHFLPQPLRKFHLSKKDFRCMSVCVCMDSLLPAFSQSAPSCRYLRMSKTHKEHPVWVYCKILFFNMLDQWDKKYKRVVHSKTLGQFKSKNSCILMNIGILFVVFFLNSWAIHVI